MWIWDDENIFDCMMNMLMALAYPFRYMVVLYVAVFSLRWSSSTWLMGADGRGSHGQQANGDSAA